MSIGVDLDPNYNDFLDGDPVYKSLQNLGSGPDLD